MIDKQEALSNKEAIDALKTIKKTQQSAIDIYRPPLLLTIFASFSYALIVLSYGMTEHENQWALGMFVGGFGLAVSIAIMTYTLHILGIKLNFLPKDRQQTKFQLSQAIIFALLVFGGRELRLMGLDFAPYVAAIGCGGLLVFLLYKYPAGAYSTKGKANE